MKHLISFSNLILLVSLLSLFTVSCKDQETIPADQNTALVKTLIGYFSKGDINSFLNGCDANCVFDVTGNQILNPGKVYNGTQGFMAFLGDLSAKGQPTVITPEEYYESGDVVTVNGKLEFKDFATGQTCKVNFIQLWKFSGDKLIAFKEDHDNRVCQ